MDRVALGAVQERAREGVLGVHPARGRGRIGVFQPAVGVGDGRAVVVVDDRRGGSVRVDHLWKAPILALRFAPQAGRGKMPADRPLRARPIASERGAGARWHSSAKSCRTSRAANVAPSNPCWASSWRSPASPPIPTARPTSSAWPSWRSRPCAGSARRPSSFRVPGGAPDRPGLVRRGTGPAHRHRIQPPRRTAGLEGDRALADASPSGSQAGRHLLRPRDHRRQGAGADGALRRQGRPRRGRAREHPLPVGDRGGGGLAALRGDPRRRSASAAATDAVIVSDTVWVSRGPAVALVRPARPAAVPLPPGDGGDRPALRQHRRRGAQPGRGAVPARERDLRRAHRPREDPRLLRGRRQAHPQGDPRLQGVRASA